MPEGDAVWRTAQRLHEVFADTTMTEWELRWGDLGATDRRGRVTIEVVPRGKHLLHRFDDGWTLHSHLRMDGSWLVLTAATVTPRQRRDRWVRALLGTGEVVALGRALGNLDLVRTRDEGRLVGHLGPDLLGADWDGEEAVRRLRAHPRVELGAALLDQRNLAGMGTIWVSETCYLERVSPWRVIEDLDDQVLSGLVGRAHQLLRATLRQRRSVSTGNWRVPFHIYGRARRGCPRCGAVVALATIGRPPHQRRLYYCPGCQPPP